MDWTDPEALRLFDKAWLFIEYDAPVSQRALSHLHRIQANDPLGKSILKTIPADQ